MPPGPLSNTPFCYYCPDLWGTGGQWLKTSKDYPCPPLRDGSFPDGIEQEDGRANEANMDRAVICPLVGLYHQPL